MKSSVTIIIAVALVCLSAAVFLFAGNEPAQQKPEQAAAPLHEAPVAPPAPAAPAAKKLQPAKVTGLKKPLGCIEVVGDRYEGGAMAGFGDSPRDGVTVFNGCKDAIVITDVKANSTSLAYVSSIFPARAVLRGPPRHKEQDVLVALSREGERCDLEGMEGRVCRFVPLPPRRSMFFSVPLKRYFSINFQNEGRVTGYLLEPIDPKNPPPKETVKMPEKGFTFKRQD